VPSGTPECSSKSCASRRTAPSPVPGVPPVEKPSPMQRATSAMPGPSSIDTTSTWPGRGAISRRPRWACRTRLVPSSVTTSASRPAAVSSSPQSAASKAACRRASPTRVASSMGKAAWKPPAIISIA
jgi:hypothetical protein